MAARAAGSAGGVERCAFFSCGFKGAGAEAVLGSGIRGRRCGKCGGAPVDTVRGMLYARARARTVWVMAAAAVATARRRSGTVLAAAPLLGQGNAFWGRRRALSCPVACMSCPFALSARRGRRLRSGPFLCGAVCPLRRCSPSAACGPHGMARGHFVDAGPCISCAHRLAADRWTAVL
jgi:hypothetical protein